MHLLGADTKRVAQNVDDRWGLVVISKSGGTLETAAAFRQFLAALETSCRGDRAKMAELTIPVTGDGGKLYKFAKELGCPEIFPVPDGVGGRFSVLSAVGLVPAALLGINVIELLTGAVEMTRHFRDAAPEDTSFFRWLRSSSVGKETRSQHTSAERMEQGVGNSGALVRSIIG